MTAAIRLAAAIDPVAQAIAGPIPGAVLGVVTAAGDRAVTRGPGAARAGAVPSGATPGSTSPR